MASLSSVGSVNAKGGVAWERQELRDIKPDYKLIVDCVAGERVVKKGGSKYLPMPNPDDASDANVARYTAYKTRAVFYNVTQHTLSGLVGEVFRKDPMSEIPTGLDIVLEDANGEGLTLTQLAKKAVRTALSMGRGGLLTDYPAVEGATSKADIDANKVQPTLTVYNGLQVINWRTEKTQNKTRLTLVVLKEEYDDDSDPTGFAITLKTQYRVLRIKEGVYTTQVYRDGNPVGAELVPTDSKGKTFDAIPFTFIGSENNDSDIDHPPLYDMAAVNIGHYRNSADYEESSFVTGQPTPVVSGITEEWATNVLKGEIRMGARGGVMLPEGGKAELMQPEPNTMPFEAMGHKENQMVALGARLVEQNDTQRTATEAGIDNASETSVLSNVAKNVSAAIKFGLEFAGQFVGIDAEIVYELNTDFTLARMTAQDRDQLIKEWQGGALAFEEMRAALRKTGVATLDDEEARTKIDEEEEAFRKKTEGDEDGDDNNDDGDED